MENFLYQEERKVSRNLMLKAFIPISKSLIFVPVSELKRGLVTRERCANRRQYPLLYFSENPHIMPLCFIHGKACEGGISQKTGRNQWTINNGQLAVSDYCLSDFNCRLFFLLTTQLSNINCLLVSQKLSIVNCPLSTEQSFRELKL